jgi:hypothetical protein
MAPRDVHGRADSENSITSAVRHERHQERRLNRKARLEKYSENVASRTPKPLMDTGAI